MLMKNNNLSTKIKRTLVGGISALCVVCGIATYGVCSTMSVDPTTNMLAVTSDKQDAIANETVEIQVQASMLKQPLAKTSDEKAIDVNVEKDNTYSVDMVNTYEEKSVEINGGELLEAGGVSRR